MLGMKNESKIEYPCFKLRIIFIGTKHIKQIFRNRKLGIRIVYKKTSAVIGISVSLITVYCKYREKRYQFNTLTQNVGN